MKLIIILTVIFSIISLNLFCFPLENDVILSTEKYYPVISQIKENVKEVTFQGQSAKGAYDAKIISNNHWVPEGYFTRTLWDTWVEKPLPIANSKLYVGYSYGYPGLFPPQMNTMSTNSGGSPRIGGSISLLRNFSIDENRLNLKNSLLKINQVKNASDFEIKTIKRDAIIAYYNWISQLSVKLVYQDLFNLSQSRSANLATQVKAGDISEITVKENLQYLARRKAELDLKEMNAKQASYLLSLFLRDENGKPQQLSNEVNEEIIFYLENKIEKIKNEINEKNHFDLSKIAMRPDIWAITQDIKMNEEELKLADNQYLPQVDLGFDYTRNQGEEDFTNAPEVVTVLLKIEIPLEYNLIKGNKEVINARKNILDSQIKFAREKAEVEINTSQFNLEKSISRMENAKIEKTYAFDLLKSENIKFQKGGSNLFLVNLREEALASAKENYISSMMELIHSKMILELATTVSE